MKFLWSERSLINLKIAFDAIRANQVRSILTALGIIFGVAAVITMLAIGKGAKEEILSQIELVGVNNIEIRPVIEQEEGEVGEETRIAAEKKFSKGLALKDVHSIQTIIPQVSGISPEIIIETFVINQGKQRSAKLIGVTPSFFDISNIHIRKGQYFSALQLENAEAVCIIGNGVQKKFFTGDDPIGKELKVGNQWLTVIGVTEEKSISQKAIDNLGIRDYNMDIYAPIQTVLIRYKNRALLLAGEKQRRGSSDDEEEESSSTFNYHQIDRMVVQVDKSEFLNASAEVISRMLKRKHNNVVDFEITIPQQLLEQQQKTKDIFNIVLSAIAGISLLVLVL